MEAVMEPKFNLWIENNGEVVLSLWRADLLQAIATTSSLKEAAEKMKISTKEAQEKLQEMERGSGIKFVTSTSQNDSNKMKLTTEGEQLLKKFREFSKGFGAEVAEKFNKSFKE